MKVERVETRWDPPLQMLRGSKRFSKMPIMGVSKLHINGGTGLKMLHVNYPVT